jgi:hypothetical protein
MSIVSCPNCGHPNADSAKFCAKCGNKLTPAETLVMGIGDPSQSMPSSPPVAPREATPPLSAKEQAGYGAPPVGYAPPAYTPARTPIAPTPSLPTTDGESAHRYVAMRTIAGLCNILAWASLVLGFLGGLIWGYIIGSNLIGSGFFGIIGGLIAGAISGGLGWVYWRLLGEGIWLALDIEANTRRSAAALENQQRL